MSTELVFDGNRITKILSEIHGRPVGLRIEHADGRVSTVAAPETQELAPDQVAPSQQALRDSAYGLLRNQGHSHEAAVLMMGVPSYGRRRRTTVHLR